MATMRYITAKSFFYLAYFLDRFGEEATKALNNNPENGLGSVDDTLAALNITDAETGELITADDVFIDWAAALYLQDESVGDGRYTYHNYPGRPADHRYRGHFRLSAVCSIPPSQSVWN